MNTCELRARKTPRNLLLILDLDYAPRRIGLSIRTREHVPARLARSLDL